MLLPKYKCHKEVRAALIVGIELTDEGAKLVLEVGPCKGEVVSTDVDSKWMKKHRPHVGGIFVQYEDGYESFSPKRAFEDGYTLIEEGK